MSIIKLQTTINAPIERCFDLSRSVDLHLISAKETSERAIEGVTSGLMSLDDIVVWQARHFGVMQKLTVKITKFNRPFYFQDSQVKGIFKSFTHDHHFSDHEGKSLMIDTFTFECPLGVLGKIVDPIVKWHLTNFMKLRNQVIKEVAEGDEWNSLI